MLKCDFTGFIDIFEGSNVLGHPLVNICLSVSLAMCLCQSMSICFPVQPWLYAETSSNVRVDANANNI